ncbi:hypothetical protein PAMA_002804 [Pampus argenteus]
MRMRGQLRNKSVQTPQGQKKAEARTSIPNLSSRNRAVTAPSSLDTAIMEYVDNATGTQHVISRYYGSDFMGHSRAEDMLGHFNRLICDYVRVCGGVVKVPLTKELLNECATARSRYRIFLEDERKKKEKTKQRDKRKGAENELEELRKKRRTISTVCETLEKDADCLAEKAENTAGTKMAELITKSNSMRKRCKDKRGELMDLDREIEKRVMELHHMS